jgi:condensin complex subunit 2
VDKEPEEGVDAPKRKSRKAQFFIDFSDPGGVDPKLFSPAKSSTISNAKSKKSAQTSNTLPEDVHYDVKMLTQLFNKPNWHINVSKRKRDSDAAAAWQSPGARRPPESGAGAQQDEQQNDGDEANMNLADDYNLYGVDFGGPGDDDDGFLAAANQQHQQQQQQQLGDVAPELGQQVGFLEEPRRPEQITINYVKTAKFIDVKALKSNLWSKLQQVEPLASVPPPAPQQSPGGVHDVDDESAKNARDFQEALDEIPKSTSAQDMANISIPFCFICLLHLANEKELSLQSNGLSQLLVHGLPTA